MNHKPNWRLFDTPEAEHAYACEILEQMLIDQAGNKHLVWTPTETYASHMIQTLKHCDPERTEALNQEFKSRLAEERTR